MLVISYNGNKPTTDYYKYSVQGNNNADIIRFSVSLTQGSLVFSDLFHIYAKVQSVDDDFYDKVELTDVEFDDSENLLNAHFLLESKHTSHRQIEVSLCCENIDSEIVWQTQLVKIAIANGVQSEEEIANQYPTILAQLQQQIDELKQQGGGGSSEVEIEKVWLSYDDKKSIIANYLGLQDDNEEPFVNDSTRIWFNFKTTPISNAIEQEIKNGRFVIRLDYPNRSRTNIMNASLVMEHQAQSKNGVGSRSYWHSFNGTPRKQIKKEILLNSLIYINEDDIKTNRYGEKYIHKKISFNDYVNRTCRVFDDDEQVVIMPITNEMIKDEYSGLFQEYLNGEFALGVPTTIQHGAGYDEKDDMSFYKGTTKNKFYLTRMGYTGSAKSFPNTIKLNPAFSCYCPYIIPSDYGERYKIYSPYFVGKKTFYYGAGGGYYWIMVGRVSADPIGKKGTKSADPIGKKGTKLAYMSARPRCAILNDDFETADVPFLKIYPQSTQQIKLMCKAMRDIAYSGVAVCPIFRTIITQK